MTSQISSAFIGAGPVSTVSMASTLDTARDEITGLQGCGPFFCGTTGGSSSAYTAVYSGDATLTLTDGLTIIITPHAENTVNSPTLQLNALDTETVRSSNILIPTGSLGLGRLRVGNFYRLTYVAALNGWVIEPVGMAMYGVPLVSGTRCLSSTQLISGTGTLDLDTAMCGYTNYDTSTNVFTPETGVTGVRFTGYFRWNTAVTNDKLIQVYRSSTAVFTSVARQISGNTINAFQTPIIAPSGNTFTIRAVSVPSNSTVGVAGTHGLSAYVTMEQFVL